MNNFKVGDWVRYVNGKTKTVARVEIINQIPNYIGVSTGDNVHIEDCELWTPEVNEWCFIKQSWNDGVFFKIEKIEDDMVCSTRRWYQISDCQPLIDGSFKSIKEN